MGKATRWLKNLLPSKKEEREFPKCAEKKRWSFKSSRNSTEKGSTVNENNAAWSKSTNESSESDNEQRKHAIAVAVATAAAADAAVTAAQAAAAVLRLTSHGRSSSYSKGSLCYLAALKIQTAFRSFLAKKAFRALKALVKIQALVRGYIVRKQAAATLRSMQALIRVQETIRAKKSHNLSSYDRKKSIEQLDKPTTEYNNMYERSPKVVEIDTFRPKVTPVYTGRPEEVMDYDWCRYSYTAQSTPRYLNNYNIAPPSPAKSVNGDLRRSANYMSSTQSFEAKVRVQKKRVPLSEVKVDQSRGSLSGVGMQKSCVRAQENAGLNLNLNLNSNYENGFGRFEYDREMGRDLYLENKW